jgi:hypothetical protein
MNKPKPRGGWSGGPVRSNSDDTRLAVAALLCGVVAVVAMVAIVYRP